MNDLPVLSVLPGRKRQISGEQKEVYLLRNLSRGKGIGFFDKKGFYPDFILRIKDAYTQRIIFIEPHGMLYAKAYKNDDKVRLHEKLPELADEISKRTGIQNIELDSFIISATPYKEQRERYEGGKWDKKQFEEETHSHFAIRKRGL